ncbi:HIT family protein [Sporanaerobium hydrogeniformans]|uniref:HIT family protein n=1 Tax=Sporanaerobium hydrogeniformans TaxID=3072179 RepID=A0AC61DAF6_9FIRM|nr:HIT family protein [Sporanaerobium hydrogeniformans]PHV70038.1 HIT family protein [Sporanaerobium hydrogeniformans]
MEENCIFCKIIKGEIPSFTIYEDIYFKAILDRAPANLGHTLILPKKHAQDIFDLPEEEAQKLYPLVKKLAIQIKEAVGAEGINIVQNNGEAAGQSVGHFHIHIVPRYKEDGVTLNKTAHSEITMDELKGVCEKMISRG